MKNLLNDANFWKRVHLILTFVWIIVVPLMVIFEWWREVAFVSVISVYANVVGHWSAWQASRAEGQTEKPPKN